MAGRKIDDLTAAKAASLRRAGESYRAIADALKVDPRTAKAMIARVSDAEEMEYWKVVGQQVDAGLLKDHYTLLLYTGTGVLLGVAADPVDTAQDPDIWLIHKVADALGQARDLLHQRGIGISSQSGLLDDHLVDSWVADRLLQGLKEHETPLADALDGPEGWMKRWRRVRNVRGHLIKQAKKLLSQKKVDGDRADRVAGAIVQDAWVAWAQAAAGSPKWGKQLSPQAQSDVGDYQWVLERVSHPDAVRPLQEAGWALRKAVSRVGSAIGDLQLRGRPAGRCSLCPSSGGILSLAVPSTLKRPAQASSPPLE